MKKKVSLKDIAKKVGVSTATVSYVLSKGEESRVSLKVAEKVKKAARELNYRPNQIAKSLKSGKTFTIGLIVADISNPFFAHIARIVEDEAKKLDYTVLFGSCDEKADKSWDLVQFLSNRQVDGFIIAAAEGSEKQIEYLKTNNIPFVLIDRYFPEIESNYVVINNYKAAYKATRRLIQTGNSRIGIIAYASSLHHMRERIRGYKNAMEDGNLEIKEDWVNEIRFSNIKQEVKLAIDNMLLSKNKVDAILFATNTLAVYGLKYIDELNYKIPEDIAIISFDEGEAFDFYYCPLTYVKQPLKGFGENAVKILTDQISDPALKKEQVCLEAELIIRKSCKRG
ncbi:LacI family DNA-binding transcriptional regulator [Sinomicrobium weinanense]|uniref:Substrate-binding domain-containing protein n=1 Tax=Sinomicrobium weinanense TaxID=2842200 RepID=A0A926Q3G3_9FLAO|nr:substrate-binding domain-containing protein [Sinomicrobium weinanense]MBC9795730.1 substrate-binding domain-containing protein [Sinomicrobium weinanense]MBU3125293.1 substrate-binding domain-containing protein [Sinomicrobium weinanense]